MLHRRATRVSRSVSHSGVMLHRLCDSAGIVTQLRRKSTQKRPANVAGRLVENSGTLSASWLAGRLSGAKGDAIRFAKHTRLARFPRPALSGALRGKHVLRGRQAGIARVHQLTIWQHDERMRRILLDRSHSRWALRPLEYAEPGASHTLYHGILLPFLWFHVAGYAAQHGCCGVALILTPTRMKSVLSR